MTKTTSEEQDTEISGTDKVAATKPDEVVEAVKADEVVEAVKADEDVETVKADEVVEAAIPKPTLLDPAPEVCEAPIVPPSERTDEIPIVDTAGAELIIRKDEEQLLSASEVQGGLGPRANMLPEPRGMFEFSPWGLWTIVGLSAIYLGNFTMGVDIIPDNIPLIGNADEVVAFLIGQQAYVAIQYGKSYLFKVKAMVTGSEE